MRVGINTCLALSILLIFNLSCSTNNNDTDEIESVPINRANDTILVSIAHAYEGKFKKEIICNGKVFAANKIDIQFTTAGKISKIYFKNGDMVTTGKTIASLETVDLLRQLARKKAEISKSLVELDDRLIDYGYRLKDSSRVPKDLLKIAKVRSGYNTAVYDYHDVQYLIKQTQIQAPFSGKIANMEAKVFSNTNEYKKLCTLINDDFLNVQFSVLESESDFVKLNSEISIFITGQDRIIARGKITSINPLIDDSGLKYITGVIKNDRNILLDGMKIMVIISNEVPNQLIIPKSAVVQRQNKNVVFTYEKGRAKWNYVELGIQNSNEIIVNSGIISGEKVIVDNNINLADGTLVSVAK